MTPSDRLSLNQATVNKLTVTEAIDLCVRHDIPAIGLWREHVADVGHINFPPITAAVAGAGYPGYIEVEIFNEAVWNTPADETAAKLRATFPQVF